MELQPSHRDVQTIHESQHLDRSPLMRRVEENHHASSLQLAKEVESQTGVIVSRDTIQHNCRGMACMGVIH
ncbi:unnamed protein product, partial [Staurois parvus]